MDQIAEKLKELNGLLAASGIPFPLGYYDPQKLKLIETNARLLRMIATGLAGPEAAA